MASGPNCGVAPWPGLVAGYLVHGSSTSAQVSGVATIVAVPDVVGLTQAAAEDGARAQGLVVAVEVIHSQTVDQGHVLMQNPGPGENVRRGTQIVIKISG